MKVAVFGTGAVGGYFGARLAQSGKEVVFIARGKHLQAMKDEGLKIDSIKGDFKLQTVQATDNPSQVGIVDLVIVGVKAWQVPGVANSMKSMIGPETVVLPLQNGIEAPSQLAAVLGEEHVLGGLCGLISFIAEPGYIRHVGTDPFIRFGELNNRPSHRVGRLRKAFEQASGVTVSIPSDIHVAMWQKFILIAAWSGMGAITRSPVGIFRSQPATRQMLEQTIIEICNVAHARGVELPENIVIKTMEFFDSLPEKGTASMQRDIMDGKPSELEFQNGAVVRLSQEMGIETPINAFIYNSLRPMEMRARGNLVF